MKVSIEYEVKSKTLLPGTIEIPKGDRTYIFKPNEDHMLGKIQIISKVLDPKKFSSQIIKTPQEYTKHTIQVNSDKLLLDSIMKDFQYLESALALESNLKSVDWQTRSYQVICETEEEEKLVAVHGIDIGRSYPDEPVPANEAILSAILDAKDRLSPLTVLLGFYREGKGDYFDLKYINAFFSHYFVLEGIYGNGKTKNRDVESEFRKSDELKEFLEVIIKKMILAYPPHVNRMNEMLKAKAINPDNLIELIVLTRGELHHYNVKRPRVTPFSHEDYQTITAILQNLALRAILARIVEINSKVRPE